MEGEAEAVAESVGETTASIVEGAIESAHANLQSAEEAAAAIAEGALEGERGRRIETLERSIEECRIAIAEVREGQQSLLSLREQVAEMNGALAALVMSAPTPSSSIPTPPLEVEPVIVEPAPIGDPNDAPPVAEIVPEAVPKRKRARWI